MAKKYKKEEIRIVPGPCTINDYWIVEQTPNVILLTFDMKTKRGDISYHFSSNGEWGLGIMPNDFSVHVDEKLDGFTEVYFDGLNSNNWTVFASDYSRYTINVCLHKMK